MARQRPTAHLFTASTSIHPPRQHVEAKRWSQDVVSEKAGDDISGMNEAHIMSTDHTVLEPLVVVIALLLLGLVVVLVVV